MAYPLAVGLNLGAANSGLTLEAQLKSSAGANVGSAITTGFTEFGASGNYQWFTNAMPDGHQGGIVFQVSPGGAVKTFVAINPAEVENSDVRTSSIIATVDAITSGVTIDGTSLTLERGDTWSIVVTGLGSLVGRSKLWFTLKDQHSLTDQESLVQIEESGGLLFLNGAAAGTAADGSLVVTDANAGNVTITVKPGATAILPPSTRLYWDIQSLISGVVLTRTAGSARISADVTRSTS